ncbi:hypothetical protein BMQ_pBM40052 (plasmid) [Priestia megaterium QM B1551]|uniref:Uncharacterized protein n=1 Tax=Priestia megaterium (strain ATCC 12872 / QMB1551) TaxID=545693 RepID=D5E3F8_PRIM1|nr:hypothetical protein BMQ_pBM40052 [Priestia megaterium QM B1551]
MCSILILKLSFTTIKKATSASSGFPFKNRYILLNHHRLMSQILVLNPQSFLL